MTAEPDPFHAIQARGEVESLARFEAALLAGYQGAIDRSRGAATAIVTSASAIAVIYSSVLSLGFAQSNAPLPVVSLIPALFFGAAILSATGFLAHYSAARGGGTARLTTDSETGLQARTFARIQSFSRWVGLYLRTRVPFLVAAVIALSVGVISMPAPLLLAPAPIVDETTIEWPAVDNSLPTELRTIRYEREVDLALANAKAAPAAGEGAQLTVTLMAAVGATVLVVFPHVTARRRSRSEPSLATEST